MLELLLEARRSGATGAGLALPVEGDLLGLGGPRTFNDAAIESGEAVVLGAWASRAGGRGRGRPLARAPVGAAPAARRGRGRSAAARCPARRGEPARRPRRRPLATRGGGPADEPRAPADPRRATRHAAEVRGPGGARAAGLGHRRAGARGRRRCRCRRTRSRPAGPRCSRWSAPPGERSSPPARPRCGRTSDEPVCTSLDECGRRHPRANRLGLEMIDTDEIPKTLLITITGKDRPGVTSAMFRPSRPRASRSSTSSRSCSGAGSCSASSSRRPGTGRSCAPPSSSTAAELGMQVEVDRGAGRQQAAPRRPLARHHHRRPAQGLRDGRDRRPDRRLRRQHRPDRAHGALPRHGDRPGHVSGADARDPAPAPGRRGRPSRASTSPSSAPTCCAASLRLIVMDVDSTLIQGEVIEMIAAHAGCEAEVARDHRGGDARRARLRGVPARAGRAARGRARRRRSTRSTSRSSSAPGRPHAWCARCVASATASPSSRVASRQITDRLAADLGIHYARANELEIVDGLLTGRIVGDVVDRAGQGARAARVRRRGRRPLDARDRHRRRRQRPRHAQRGRPRHRLQRQADGARRRRQPRSTCPTSTRSSTCSASPARRSRRPTPRSASSRPLPRSTDPPTPTATHPPISSSVTTSVAQPGVVHRPRR